MQLLQPGKIVPQFNLPDQNNNLVSFSFFLGKKVLIYFYPKAMTPGCIIQARKLRDSINIFKKLEIEIIGISTDNPITLSKFYKKEMLNFTLLSDENHKISDQFGVWGEKKFMGKTYYGIHRVSFIISHNGIIKKIFENFKPNHHDTLILNYLNNQK